MLKNLFDIQRVHVDGSRLYYELFYRQGQSYTKIIDACFMTQNAAREYIKQLIDEV
jgi:hypothetical protein